MTTEKAIVFLLHQLRCNIHDQSIDRESRELQTEMLRHANAALMHAKGFVVAWEKLLKAKQQP